MYNFSIKKISCKEVDTVIIPLFEGELTVSNEEVNNKLKRLEDRKQFKGSFGETFNLTRTIENEVIQDVVVLGLGKESELSKEQLRRAFGKVQKNIESLKSENVFVKTVKVQGVSVEDTLSAMMEGLALSSYKFNKYKSDSKEETSVNVSLGGSILEDANLSSYEQILKETNILVEAVCNARNLVNEPANVIYPESLAEQAKAFGNEYGFEVEVLDHNQAEELGMDAFLSVGKASAKKPRVIVMRYFGDTDNMDKRLGLVGKGLTYDSGGYSLKPSDSMADMKSDMGGAASVIGAISAIAKSKLKINVVAIVAACENMIAGDGYKPGDIINSMGGKTIEVLNTDAEGRLTLVDAVTYIIEKEQATEIIDVATLTGAALVALGTDVTAIVTNNTEFYKELEVAFTSTGEKMWQLPSFDDYKKLIKSDIADLKNIGGRFGGTITAGLFIGEFVQNRPWLHLDIAGPAYTTSPWDYCPKGGTGAGVRTLFELAKNRSK